ncbi:MAG: response regulator [Rhodanobacteraceae bacterium]
MNTATVLQRCFGTIADVSSDRRRSKRVGARDGTRILLVEDSATVTTVLQRMLLQNHYATYPVVAAEDGVALARRVRPHLIFLDIVLPGMNGFAALELLRADALTRNIPIILMSGSERVTRQFHAGHFDADDFMKKPFSRWDVFSRIERLLGPDHVIGRASMQTLHGTAQSA